MSTNGIRVLAALAAGLLLAGPGSAQEAKKPRPQVEVVFCLDTTGSMGGLIEAAKQKIWSISNQIAGGKPTPTLRVGLVAYRDRGDEYVTKVFDLTDDLDAVYANLMKFQANGGGDFPESVNQALHESVTKVSWGKDNKTLKIIFLVGDAPPKADYADDVKYQDTCQLAAKNGIIINTIQCGGHAQTQKFWQEICRLAEGQYVQIDQGGGPVTVVATPFDEDLRKLNSELSARTLVYGSGGARRDAEARKGVAAALPAPAAAARAGYFGKSGKGASYDLLDAVKEGKVQLEKLAKEELPAELQGKSVADQKAILKKLETERQGLLRNAAELDRKRNAYIQQKLADKDADRPADGFDQQVLRMLQQQARRVNLEYATEPANTQPQKK